MIKINGNAIRENIFFLFSFFILRVYIVSFPLTTLFVFVIIPTMGNNDNVTKPEYAVGQQVVYPLHGVGKIINIEEKEFKDNKILYYEIYIEVSDMTVMIPVDKTEERGIRPIVTEEESQEALAIISEEYEPVPSDWKIRYQMNLDLLKSGTVKNIAIVVRTLFHRSRIKELPILERKLYDNALQLLVDEISFSLEKEKTEVEDMIYKKMEAVASNME